MEKNIELLNVLYQNAEMGIIGIEDVMYKVHNQKLYKELESEKKEYQKIIKHVKRMLKVENGQSKSINMLAKISSTLYSDMKLMKNDSDKLIIKMMIEGSYKSIGILTTKKLEYDNTSLDIKDFLDLFIKVLNKNISNLIKIDKIV
jgi:hypothetical protein